MVYKISIVIHHIPKAALDPKRRDADQNERTQAPSKRLYWWGRFMDRKTGKEDEKNMGAISACPVAGSSHVVDRTMMFVQ